MITIIKNTMHAYNYEITIFSMIYCLSSNDFLIFPRFQTFEIDSGEYFYFTKIFNNVT